MSAEDALRYGLIDEIVQPNDAKIRDFALPPPSAAPDLFGKLPAGAEEYKFGKIVSDSLLHILVLIYFLCV